MSPWRRSECDTVAVTLVVDRGLVGGVGRVRVAVVGAARRISVMHTGASDMVTWMVAVDSAEWRRRLTWELAVTGATGCASGLQGIVEARKRVLQKMQIVHYQ